MTPFRGQRSRSPGHDVKTWQLVCRSGQLVYYDIQADSSRWLLKSPLVGGRGSEVILWRPNTGCTVVCFRPEGHFFCLLWVECWIYGKCISVHSLNFWHGEHSARGDLFGSAESVGRMPLNRVTVTEFCDSFPGLEFHGKYFHVNWQILPYILVCMCSVT